MKYFKCELLVPYRGTVSAYPRLAERSQMQKELRGAKLGDVQL